MKKLIVLSVVVLVLPAAAAVTRDPEPQVAFTAPVPVLVQAL